MPSPSSKKGEPSAAPNLFSSIPPLALPETVPAPTPAVQTAVLVRRQPQGSARIPEFSPELDDDVTPETEEESSAWVALMRKDPAGWLKKLKPRTPNWTPQDLAEDFATMYGEYADTVPSRLIQFRIRRPDAAADAKPFPLKMGLFYLIVCGIVAVMIMVALLLAR